MDEKQTLVAQIAGDIVARVAASIAAKESVCYSAQQLNTDRMAIVDFAVYAARRIVEESISDS